MAKPEERGCTFGSTPLAAHFTVCRWITGLQVSCSLYIHKDHQKVSISQMGKLRTEIQSTLGIPVVRSSSCPSIQKPLPCEKQADSRGEHSCGHVSWPLCLTYSKIDLPALPHR